MRRSNDAVSFTIPYETVAMIKRTPLAKTHEPSFTNNALR
jgi:hypothetical protein